MPHKKKVLRAPRLTGWGYLYLFAYLGLPLLMLLAALDGLLYLFFRFGLDRCYGIWCFF